MASRKLQGEIERVLKKVDEGVQIFEQTWDKVYSATTTAQKEKYEGDLKKEIKKLQRLRDQIKTWQGDSSIKDKTKLDENRKLIEQKMEKFKICEKETKTKAFSKEGLAQDRTDPRVKAKGEINDWVGDAIRKIQEQNEEIESEIETLNSGKRRKRSEENPRATQLKEFMSRNEHHIAMLERVLRAVDNDAIEPEDVNELKDSVDYYVESNQEPDFYDDEELYDSLNLDNVPAPALASARKNRESRDEDNSSSTPSASSVKKSTVSASPKHQSAPKGRGGGNSRNANVGRNSSPARKTGGTNQSPAVNGNSHTVHSPRVRPGGPLMSSVVKSGSAAVAAKQQQAQNAPEPVVRQIFKSKAATTTSSGAATFSEPLKPTTTAASASQTNTSSHMRWNGVVARTTGRDVGAAAAGTAASHPPQTSPKAIPPTTLPSAPAERLMRASAPSTSQTKRSEAISAKEARRKGPIGFPMPSASELAAQSAALERACKLIPDDRMIFGSRPTMTPASSPTAPMPPRNPVNVPASFPNVPSSVFEKQNIFLKFDPDTLFFIFYYQQGTLQQYLAAKELKRQGWRFHKKYLTWFQRHDEPKVVNDEYETGTFIYFDYANVVFRGRGSGWCQRIKSEFVFEYVHLEDEL